MEAAVKDDHGEDQGAQAEAKDGLNVAVSFFGLVHLMYIMRNLKETERLVKMFAIELHDGPDTHEIIIQSAILHDIGKFTAGLQACDTLESVGEEDREKMRKHPELSIEFKQALRKSSGPMAFKKVPEVIAQHEERCDGSGYPHGLKKVQISFFSQILIVVNVFDHLVNFQGKSRQEAVKIIARDANKFNRHVVTILEYSLTTGMTDRGVKNLSAKRMEELRLKRRAK